MRKYYQRAGLVIAVTALFSILALAVPAWGMSGSIKCPTRIDQSGCDSDGETDIHKVRESSDLTEQFREQAKQQMEALREQGEKHSQEFRQKSCEARKVNLERRLDRKLTSAQKHQDVFDKIYNRVKSFHDSKNLNTPDYDQLMVKVDAAQTNASTHIASLQTLDISVDCTQDNVADQLSAFKVALGETRTALKDYRTALVEFIKAVHQSAESSSNSESQ